MLRLRPWPAEDYKYVSSIGICRSLLSGQPREATSIRNVFAGRLAIMARRSGAPKQPVKATLSRQDMTSGIKKLERRLKELNDFDLDTLDPDDPELKKLEDRVQMAITDIFGQGTIEYKQFHVSSLTSWSKRGIIVIGGYKSPQVTHAKM